MIYVHEQANVGIWTRKSWADNWRKTRNASTDRWRHGSGTQAGSCTIRAVASTAELREIGAQTSVDIAPNSFVMVTPAVIYNQAGKVSEDPADATPWWTGWIAEIDKERDGSAPTSYRTWHTAHAVGIAGLLAQIDIARHFALYRDGTLRPTAVEAPPVFAEHAIDDGLPATPSGGGPVQWFVHRIGSGERWTALRLLQSLLDANMSDIKADGTTTQRLPHWPKFEIDGQVDCLKYEVTDIRAMGNLLEAFAAFANPRRGCTFAIRTPATAKPSDPCKIWISSCLSAPITITSSTGSTNTIPAASPKTTIDCSFPYTQHRLSQIIAPRALAFSGRRIRIVNLRWSRADDGAETGQLTRDWPAASDDKAGDDQPKYSRVFRSFSIRDAWDGTYTGKHVEGLSPVRLVDRPSTLGSVAAPDALYGAGGLTGDLDGSTDNLPWPASTVRLLSNLPIPAGFRKKSDKTAATIEQWLETPADYEPDPATEPLPVMAWLNNRNDNTWTRLETQIAIEHERRIVVGSGPDDAADLAAALDDKKTDLVFTVAIEMPIPLTVSYVPAAPAGAVRHSLVPWADEVKLGSRTVIGLDADDKPLANNSFLTVRTDLPALRSILALARPLDDAPATVTIIDRSTLRTDIVPGHYIEKIKMDDGESGTQDIGQVVTSVEHIVAAEGYGTVITTEQPNSQQVIA